MTIGLVDPSQPNGPTFNQGYSSPEEAQSTDLGGRARVFPRQGHEHDVRGRHGEFHLWAIAARSRPSAHRIPLAFQPNNNDLVDIRRLITVLDPPCRARGRCRTIRDDVPAIPIHRILLLALAATMLTFAYAPYGQFLPRVDRTGAMAAGSLDRRPAFGERRLGLVRRLMFNLVNFSWLWGATRTGMIGRRVPLPVLGIGGSDHSTDFAAPDYSSASRSCRSS
jgi:hypothetical protein